MLKKKVFRVMSLLLAASMLTACGSTKSDSGKTETIKVMIWDRGTAAAGTSQEENPTVDWIREQVKAECNLNVEFMAVPRSGSDDKLNIMMSGGGAPDIVFTYDQNIFTNYATNGGLADLSEAYEKNGSKIKEISGDLQFMGQLDGKQYALMKQREASGTRHMSYIRKDWLDALNMEVPTNKEELFACLYAFKKKNPGNVANVIPWAMGGATDSERSYLNFVGSYVAPQSEREGYIYSDGYKVFAPGAIDGIKKLNELYNDGIISKDFVTDTARDLYMQDVNAGNAGFILDDRTYPFSNIPVLKSAVEGAQLVPVNCFDLPDGSHCLPAEPLYGMFVMVPKTSQEKADAVVKYLNWMVNPEVAENLSYSPGHTRNEAGIPKWLTEEESKAGKYPGNGPDYNIMNDRFEYVTTKEGMVAAWTTSNDWETDEWFGNMYDLVYEDGHYVFPSYPAVIDSENLYGSNVKKSAIEYVYKLICCPKDQFDTTQKAEYEKLVSAGLEKILEERASYYDANVAK